MPNSSCRLSAVGVTGKPAKGGKAEEQPGHGRRRSRQPACPGSPHGLQAHDKGRLEKRDGEVHYRKANEPRLLEGWLALPPACPGRREFPSASSQLDQKTWPISPSSVANMGISQEIL